ncbi:uncharacterized [Tachysurus ichikawai]
MSVFVSEALSSLNPNFPFLAYKLKQKHTEIEEPFAPEDHPYADKASTQRDNGRALIRLFSQIYIHPSLCFRTSHSAGSLFFSCRGRGSDRP